jgi:hypothetical protein
MAILSPQDRNRMPAKDFAGPNRSFPMNDPAHARMAISGATRAEHAGHISPEEKDRIQSEARAKLAKWDGKGGDPKGGAEAHKAAVAKMHPDHVHRLVTEAAAGLHGPKAMDRGQMAMQEPQDGTETGNSGGQAPQEAPAAKSPFADNDADDSQQAAPSGPPSRAAMFGMEG